MFEHFTFGAQAQSSSLFDEAEPSPRDISFPSPLSPSASYFSERGNSSDINNIAHRFSQQSLQSWRDNEVAKPLQLPSPASSTVEDEDDELFPSISRQILQSQSVPNSPLLPTSSSPIACRRLQRQLNVQLQSCSNHLRDIDALVAEMISTSSQCNLHHKTSSLSSPTKIQTPYGALVAVDDDNTSERELMVDDDDEGFSELREDELFELEQEMSLRRASIPSGIRKLGLIRYRSSADTVGSCKVKVKRMPRMRTRKVHSPPRIPES